MPDIHAQTDDGVIHVFPDGTPDDVIDRTIKSYTSAASNALTQKTQAAAKAGGVTSPGVAPVVPPKVNPTTGGDISEQPIGQPIAPMGAAASIPRAVGGVVGGVTAGTVGSMVSKNPWVRDLAALGGGLLGEGAGAATEGPLSVGRGIGRDIANKYLGKTAADAILPPPPEPPVNIEAEAAQQVAKEKALRVEREKAGLLSPPPDPEYVRQKTITEAQEAAQKQNNVFDASARREAEKVATERNAAYQKEAEENVAIQKRADDATAERMAAEKEAKNNQLKLDQAHEKALKEIETARQKELMAQARVRQIQEDLDKADTVKEAKSIESLKAQQKQAISEANKRAADTERLRTMHGDDLMRRGKEQDALTKAAEDAVKEEETAKKAALAARPKLTRPGSSGMRPTETEMRLTRLQKRRIWTPGDLRDAIHEIGPSALREPNEGLAEYHARVMGLIRSQRAAIGMEDVESGPSAGSQLPPPPNP